MRSIVVPFLRHLHILWPVLRDRSQAEHDGVQQQLVSLMLKIRTAEAMVPAELEMLKHRLEREMEPAEDSLRIYRLREPRDRP